MVQLSLLLHFISFLPGLTYSQVVYCQGSYMVRFHFRVESSDLKMILIEGDQVLSISALVCLDHSIALIVDLVLSNDLVARSQQFIHMQLFLLGAK